MGRHSLPDDYATDGSGDGAPPRRRRTVVIATMLVRAVAAGTTVAVQGGVLSFSKSCEDSAVRLTVMASPDIAPAVRAAADKARTDETKSDGHCLHFPQRADRGAQADHRPRAPGTAPRHRGRPRCRPRRGGGDSQGDRWRRVPGQRPCRDPGGDSAGGDDGRAGRPRSPGTALPGPAPAGDGRGRAEAHPPGYDTGRPTGQLCTGSPACINSAYRRVVAASAASRPSPASNPRWYVSACQDAPFTRRLQRSSMTPR